MTVILLHFKFWRAQLPAGTVWVCTDRHAIDQLIQKLIEEYPAVYDRDGFEHEVVNVNQATIKGDLWTFGTTRPDPGHPPPEPHLAALPVPRRASGDTKRLHRFVTDVEAALEQLRAA